MSRTPSLLILGKGEIARCLAQLAVLVDLPVVVTEPGAGEHPWPQGVETREAVYSDHPWPLIADSHAVIARGHEADAESVAALLNQAATHVYLIASAQRAQMVIRSALPLLTDSTQLTRLSAPAGLDLGGKRSMEIALSILAEIQRRHYAKTGQALTDLRDQNARLKKTRQHTPPCPGKRV
jgi:xanthine dehydrogenase accessory factor